MLLPEDCAAEAVANGYLVLHIPSGSLHHLNETAYSVWQTALAGADTHVDVVGSEEQVAIAALRAAALLP